MRARFYLYTSLNLLAGLAWILILLELGSRSRNPVSDYGVPAALIVLFFAIPLGACALWFMGRKKNETLPRPWKAYVLASKLFLAISWLPSLVPILFWGGIVWLGLTHTWPLSLREGPDTTFAQDRFKKHFGFAPPSSITELYCRESWEFGDGMTYRVKFRFTDDAITERVVNALGFQPLPESETKASWVIELSHPSWWPNPGSVRFQEAYGRGESRARLWIDWKDRIIYYRSWP